MTFRAGAISPLLAMAIALAASDVASAKSARPARATDVLASLKIGQWIRLAGDVQRDHSVACAELKLLAGDFVDNDWELIGRIDRIDTNRGALTIANVPIRLAEDAEFEGHDEGVDPLTVLRAGMVVEVGGTWTRDGFLAEEVDATPEDARDTSGHRLGMTARVERIDLARHRVYAMGLAFVISDGTQVKSLLR